MPDKRALIVGINTYASPHLPNLQGAIADAQAMAELLGKNQDGSPNYGCRVLPDNMEDGQPVTRAALRAACEQLCCDYTGDVLLYFSGHGVLTAAGGYLTAHNSTLDDWGIPMQEIVDMANRSRARHILLILDCCHAGDAANQAVLNGRGGDPLAVIRENMTVIASSRPTETSMEAGGHGAFTSAVLDALSGGAADHMGWVTAPAIYGYVERRFGAWDQRPVYKTYGNSVPVVRACAPLIERHKLYRLTEFFPTQSYEYRLDPEYEPDDEHGNRHEPVNEEKVAIAELFKEYRDTGLLRPSQAGEQLFWTARRSHTVQLTPRGREYWYLIAGGKI